MFVIQKSNCGFTITFISASMEAEILEKKSFNSATKDHVFVVKCLKRDLNPCQLPADDDLWPLTLLDGNEKNETS